MHLDSSVDHIDFVYTSCNAVKVRTLKILLNNIENAFIYIFADSLQCVLKTLRDFHTIHIILYRQTHEKLMSVSLFSAI